MISKLIDYTLFILKVAAFRAAAVAINNLIGIGILFAMMWLIPSLSVAMAAYPVTAVIAPFIAALALLNIPTILILHYTSTHPETQWVSFWIGIATIQSAGLIAINAIIFTAAVHFGLPAFIPHWFALSATHIAFASITLVGGPIPMNTISAQENHTPSYPFQEKGEKRQGHLDHTLTSTSTQALPKQEK